VNDQAIAALAPDPDLYHRGGTLVRFLDDDPAPAGGIRWSAGPRIEPLPRELLRERLAAAADWVVRKGKKFVDCHPPGWCIAAVHARSQYPGLRHLCAVVDHPVLRPDGILLTTPGYDAGTGLYLAAEQPMSLPDRPTLADAQAAAAHQAAWLAALLTPLARFAFDGPAPLFLVDANVRGSGKGCCSTASAPSSPASGSPSPPTPTTRTSCGSASRRWRSPATAWSCSTTWRAGSATPFWTPP
jgi:hypothetical protein